MIRGRRLVTLAVICLLAISAAPFAGGAAADNADPFPWLSEVDAPNSVVIGESFTVDITADNFGGPTGKYSTISVSSPSLEEYDDGEQVRILSENFKGYSLIKSPGDTVYNTEGNPLFARHTLVEAGTRSAYQWNGSTERELSVEFTPEDTGTFVFYVRVGLTDDGSTEVFTDPEDAQQTDQQGFYVEKYTVEVKEEPEYNAEIQSTSVDSEDVESGDTVDGSVTVKNTGNRDQTFFVGYSVYDGTGTAYDNSGSTGRTVTLNDGESQTVDVSWEVKDDAAAGTYDARLSVWNESNRNQLETRLADTRTNSVFRVREDPNIDASIESVSTPDGDYQPDDAVQSSVTVKNTGNREHTYYVGYTVYDESRTPYDDRGTTGPTVTLDPGATQTVDVSWDVPAWADAGTYDARYSIWKESDRNNLDTRLADRSRYNTFEVSPIRTIDFSVSKEASLGRFGFGGEPISGATISIAGNTLTTDANGDASIQLPVDEYTYTVSADGYVDKSMWLSMSSARNSNFETIGLRKDGVGSVEVNVVDQQNSPVPQQYYDVYVDGTQRALSPTGKVLLEEGSHTIKIKPTTRGTLNGVRAKQKEVQISEDDQKARTFVVIPVKHQLDIDVPDSGVVQLGSTGELVIGDVSRSYYEGAVVSITAKPGEEYAFDHWEGDISSSKRQQQTVEVAVTEDTTLSPVFVDNSKTNQIGWESTPPSKVTPGESLSMTISGYAEADGKACLRSYPSRGLNDMWMNEWCEQVSQGSFEFTVELSSLDKALNFEQPNYGIERFNNVRFEADLAVKSGGLGAIENLRSPANHTEMAKPAVTPSSFPYVETTRVLLPSADEQHREWEWITTKISRESLPEANKYRVTVNFTDTGTEPGGLYFFEEVEGHPNSQVLVLGNTSTSNITRIESTVDGQSRVVETFNEVDKVTTPLQVASDIATGGLKAAAKELIADYAKGIAIDFIVDNTDLGIQADWDLPTNWENSADNEGIRVIRADFDSATKADGLFDGKISEIDSYTMTLDVNVTEASGSKLVIVPDMRGKYLHNTDGTVHQYLTEYRRQITVPLPSEGDTNEPTAELSTLQTAVAELSKCGVGCRDVKYSIANPTDAAFKDLSANISISSGGTELWHGERTIDSLGPGESKLLSGRIEVGLDDLKVLEENGRTVTISVEYSAQGETRTVQFQRQL